MGNFSIALSGLTAQSDALNIVSNNLANLNTAGFKGSTASFQELVSAAMGAQQPNGMGVAPPTAQRNFSQGSVQNTGAAFDAALEGSGFFMVQSASGQQMYTRNGGFHLSSTGNLVDENGNAVLGFGATNGVVNAGGAVGPITVPMNAVMAPKASTAFSFNANLSASANVGDTFSTPVQVVDSLGATHTLTVTFTKEASDWKYDVSIPQSDLSSGGSGGGSGTTPPPLATGTVTFDNMGHLTAPDATAPVSVPVAGLADGAADLALTWNLYNTDGSATITQFAQASAVSAVNVDGNTAGQLSNVALGDNGTVVASFSNGRSQIVGQLAIAGIQNPNTLVDVGQNDFIAGDATSAPAIGVANTGGRGAVQAGALESSNVDIATEFTNLIIYQRGYQANSRVITTFDQLSQDLMQIRP